MSVQTKIVILDAEKNMQYEFEIKGQLSVNVNSQVELTITRDPGAFHELILSKVTLPVSSSFNLPLNNPEELANAMKNPDAARQIGGILADITKAYVFPALPAATDVAAAPVEGDIAAIEAEAKTTSKK